VKTFLLIFIITFFSVGNSSCKKDNETEPEYEIRQASGDYFVSPEGSDENPGTEDKPWKTLQKAVDAAEPGKTVIVKQGYYDEYVKIKKQGINKDNPTVFFSEALYGARCRGFYVNVNFIDIDGFGVEAMGETNWTGITIDKCAYVTVQNCEINECPTSGIKVKNLALYINILNNKMEHNGQNGISLVGNYCLIEGNGISRTVQNHPKGHEPGFSGADADGMRIFGTNNVIRANRLLNIGDPDDAGNIDPHVDCIQSWDGGIGGIPVMSYTLIEKNIFSTRHPSGKGILIDATNGNTCSDLIIRNNIFEFRDMGLGFYDGRFANIYVYNNIFKALLNDKSWGTSVSFRNINQFEYYNNITVDCHPQHRYIIGGGRIGYNLAWNSDGTMPTGEPAFLSNELVGGNPQFTSYTGGYGDNDYHILGNSSAIDKGLTLSNVTDDFDSIPRPQGSAYDIGPFEYKPKK